MKRVRRLEVDRPAWSENLKEAVESEALRRLAEESGRREKEARGKGVGGGHPSVIAEEKKDEEVSSSSTSSSKKKKKSKKKKRKKKSKRFRVQGKKDLKKIFEFTGLDPSLRVRRRVMRLARRAMRNRSREDSEGSSCSSTEGSSTEEAGQHLFEETHKIRKAATRGPGALTAFTISSMSKSLLTQQGLPIEETDGAVPCIALQYHKQVLSQRLSPPLARESLNICAATDALLGGQVALGLDILVQRLKSIEALGGGQSWAAAQKLELAPQEGSQLAALEESETANKELREELKNRQASQKTWQKGEKGGSKGKHEEAKGKSKREKGGKEKGRGKGEGEVVSTPLMLSEQEIEEELARMAQVAFAKERLEQKEAHHDFTMLQKPDGSEQSYNHSSEAILARTAPEGDAAPEGETTTCPLSERKKKLGAGGFRFADVVGDLLRNLSTPLRKTVTLGEVFPLPYGSFLERTPFDDLNVEVREVLKGMIVGLNSIYDCSPSATQRVSPLHVRILRGLSQEAQRFVEKSGKFDCLSWKDFLRVRSVDYKGDEVKTAQRTSWNHVKPALPQEVGAVARGRPGLYQTTQSHGA